MQKTPSLRTPLKRARGLGSAHSGTHHFWVLRVTALALVPLSIWFLTILLSRLMAPGNGRMLISEWFRQPFCTLLMVLFLVAMFVHARLGIQEIIEDYVPHKGKKVALLLINSTLIYGFGAASLLAVLHLHLYGI